MAYPGGKGRMYQHLISAMPAHRVYIETHLGGGSVMRHKRPARVNIGIERDPDVVRAWARDLPAHVDLVTGDAVTFLERYPFVGDEFVYCDPPYLASTRRRVRVYRHDYDTQDHVRLLACLRGLPCPVMISGYRSGLYDRVLSDWRRIGFAQRSQRGPTTETVWLNYEPPVLLHDHAHLGRDFRQREAVRRRRQRFVDRLMDLETVERNAVLVEVALRDPRSFRELAGLMR